MNKLILESIIIGISLAIPYGTVYAKTVRLEDVIGKLIFWSSASSMDDAYLSSGIVTKSRNTVELLLISMTIPRSSTDVTPLYDADDPNKIEYMKKIMIHCRDRRYAPYPQKEDAYSFKEYLAGKKYSWGDYSSHELISNTNQDEKNKMTQLFSDTCSYTAN